MSRAEFALRSAGVFFIAYVSFLATHNLRQYAADARVLVPEFWIVQGQAISAGAVAVGLWWAHSPKTELEATEGNNP